MFLLYVTIVIVTVYSLKKSFYYNTNKLIETKIKEVNTTIDQISNTALYIASISSEMQIVKDAYNEYYATGNLEEASDIIYSQFSKINERILASTGYEARIHFHLPPAISFCRCWSGVRGDDISDFRKSILEVSENQTFVKGIETGRGGFVIRGIAPIFASTGEYQGSVEAFFNINSLLHNIDQDKEEDFAIFMNTELLSIATNFLERSSTNIQPHKQIINGYILVDKTSEFQLDNIIQHITHHPNINVLRNNNVFQFNNFKYAVISIKNFNQEIEGIGILQIDISSQQQSMQDILVIETIIFAILLTSVLLLLGKLSDNLIVRKIVKADVSLQKLSKGELTDEIPVTQNDELGSMQLSLNKLNENITKNTNFAIEISKGNLITEYQPIGKGDMLGNSLLDMQKNLIKSSKELNQALEKSIQSEENFKNLSDLTFEGILIHNKGVAIDINNSFAKMFGYSREELIGKNLIKLLINPKYHKKISENIVKEHASNYEIEGIKRDGSTFPVEIEAKNFKNKENETIRVTAFRDITPRKKAEEELRKLSTAVEQSANSIVITDIDGNINYVNKKFTDLTGYSVKEIIGINSRILSGGTLPKTYYTNLWNTISSGNTWHGEFYNKKKNGEYYWEQVTITPIKTLEGEIINYLAIKEDITARKLAEAELQKQNRELIIAKAKAEESDQLKTEFIHNMSHEIRTPMNGILGFTDLLNKTKLQDEDQKRYVDIIKSSGTQLMQIINDILEISQLVTRQTQTVKKETCLNDLLAELHHKFEPQTKEKQLSCTLQTSLTDKESTILTDDTKLISVLNKLLENAIKFTSEGSINLGYQLKFKEDQSALVIFIKDTGIGIKPEKQEMIFARFSQGEKDLSKNVGGLGLGLSIAKENAELIGGSITLESEEGKGSTFYLTIPYKPIDT
ncbi:MAG: PAS domain S-box protein [Bacteroidota bacterium]